VDKNGCDAWLQSFQGRVAPLTAGNKCRVYWVTWQGDFLGTGPPRGVPEGPCWTPELLGIRIAIKYFIEKLLLVSLFGLVANVHIRSDASRQTGRRARSFLSILPSTVGLPPRALLLRFPGARGVGLGDGSPRRKSRHPSSYKLSVAMKRAPSDVRWVASSSSRAAVLATIVTAVIVGMLFLAGGIPTSFPINFGFSRPTQSLEVILDQVRYGSGLFNFKS
jgi:hypothetical protein